MRITVARFRTDSPDCEVSFGTWRERVAGDLAGGWIG